MRNYLANRKWLLLGGMISLSFLLRFFTSVTKVSYPDSCLYLSHAKSILNGKLSFDFKQGIEMILPPLYPLFTAAISFINGDMELAGVLVSVLAGALLIIPVFYLAKAIYNETAAWIASALVMLSPFLLHWSGVMLTESLFITLFISGITLGWYAIQQKKMFFFFLSGVFIGLSYMTRLIGLVAVPVVVLWTMFYFILPDKSGSYNLRKSFKTMISMLALFTLGFFIVTGAYLVHMRSVFGYWDITASYGSLGEVIESGGYDNIADRETRTNALSTERAGLYTILINKVAVNLKDYSLGLFTILSIMIIFVVGGLFTRWKILYVISAIAIYLAALLVQPINPMSYERIRYLSPIVPLFLVMAAGGIIYIRGWVKSGTVKKAIIPVMIGVVLISFILQLKMFDFHFYRLQVKDNSVNIQKKIALDMKKNLEPPLRVMSRKPYIPYYADATWFLTPPTYSEVMKLSISKAVDYIVVDREVDYHLRPALRFLLDPKQAPEELQFMGGTWSRTTNELYIGVYKIRRDSGMRQQR